MNTTPYKTLRIIAATAALCVVPTMASAAGTATNIMNNIVTLSDACDIVAIGVDFGVKTAPIPAGGYTSAFTNTTAGNGLTGNTNHAKSAADSATSGDGTTGNNTLSLDTGLALLNPLVTTTLSTVIGSLPGVYVACTAAPTSITLVSSSSGASVTNFPVALGTSVTETFTGKMKGVGGTATSSNLIDYSLTFVGTPVSTTISGGAALGLPALFIGAFTAVGTIPGTQTGTVVPGQYWDGAIATVNF